jgi:8-oxo-dGTP diphosphatase
MPKQGAGAVVLNVDRTQVLLQLREDIRAWGLPAGGIEHGEMPEQAAIRETREETGYEIALVRSVGEYWRPQMPGGGVLFYVFEGRVVGGDASQHDWESLAVEWFKVQALPKPMAPFAKKIIEDACAGLSEPMKRTQVLSAAGVVLMGAFLAVRRVRHKRLRRLGLDVLRWVGVVMRWDA